MLASRLHHCHSFTAFPLFSWRHFSKNWLITLTAPKFNMFCTASLTVSPQVLIHLRLLYGRLFAICAPPPTILTKWTSIWPPKSPKAAWLARSPPLLFPISIILQPVRSDSQERSARKMATYLGFIFPHSAQCQRRHSQRPIFAAIYLRRRCY